MLNKLRIILVIAAITLTACQPNADEPLKLSKEKETFLWQILQGDLFYDGQLVDWSQESIPQCKTCQIFPERIMHPSGPLVSFKLQHEGQFRAIKKEALFPWIDVNEQGKSLRLTVNSDQNKNSLIVNLPDEQLKIQPKQIVEFSIGDTEYLLWVEEFKKGQSQSSHSIEQRDLSFKFLLVRI